MKQKEDLAAAQNKMATDLKASAQAELQSSNQERNDTQKTSLVLLTGTDAIVTSDRKCDTLQPGRAEDRQL